MRTRKTVCWVVGIAAVTGIGFLVVPSLMKKCSNRLYKFSLEKEEIDFESLGPEIIEKEEPKEE